MIFTGRLDQDTNVHLVKQGDYIDAMNIRNGVGSERGVVTPAEGNTLVPYSLPTGASCIGSFEHKLDNSVIFFIKGSEDRICRYKNGVIETLVFGDLNFNERIHSCKFVNDLCYFTDGKNGAGNPPRKFNINKASRNKTLTYQLDITEAAYANGGLATLVIKTNKGVTISSNPLTSIIGGTPRVTTVNNIISALASYGITGVITSPTYTNIRVEDPTDRIIEINLSDTYFYPLNHYPLNFDLNLAKKVPVEPIPTCVVEENNNNKIFGFGFQFRCRYIYDDREKSAWGPASYTPTNFIGTDNDRSYTKIEIKLGVITERTIIRAIELAVRTSEDGIWRFVERYDIDKTDVISFYNDKSYPAIPSDESSDADTQALKNFDFCPKIAMGCEAVYDEQGNPIMVWGGCVEGEDLIEIDADITGVPYISGTGASMNKTFKCGGLYRVGVVLEDDYGRQTSVIPLGQYSVPFNKVAVQNHKPLVQFNSIPPVWAKKFRVVMTKNQNQTTYFQLPAFGLNYWKIDKTNDTAISTEYITGDANYVGLAFNPTEEISGSLRNQFFDSRADENKVFIPTSGDRIQLLKWQISRGSNPGYTNISKYNFEIKGYNLTTVTGKSTIDKFTIFVDPKDFPDFSAIPSSGTDYILCEIYRPSNSTSSQVFYEIGPTKDILDAGTDYRAFQHVDLENYGDAVAVAKRFDSSFISGETYFVTPIIERNTLHSFSTDVFTDFGRVCVEDPDYARKYEKNKIRATGLYSGNGLSSFRGSDYIRVSLQNGEIMKLAFVDGILLAIGQFKTQPIYVSRGRVIDVSGQTLVGRSSNLFSIADELRFDLGTHNPESVIVNEGACYAFDVYRGTVWRYVAGAGQDIISGGLVNFFQGFGQYAWQNQTDIIGGFQREFNTYYITGRTSFGAFTLGYNEGWVSFYSFYPEAMSSIDQRMVSFYEGQLWIHESGIVGRYFGLQTKAKLKFAYNEEPAVHKTPTKISIVADKKWDVPLVDVPADGNYPLGQTSKIPDLKAYNGIWEGSFLRDQNDPAFPINERLRRGRKLWGTVFLITVEINIFSRLLSITVNGNRKLD